MTVRLNIERLILDGVAVSPNQPALLQAAVERELTRLLTRDGVPGGWTAGGATPRVPAGAIRIGSNASPVSLGAEIARAVHRGIST